MIKFNELYIDDTGKNLIIDISVLNLPYYKNETIKDIYLIPDFNYNEGSVEGAIWLLTKHATAKGKTLSDFKTSTTLINANSNNTLITTTSTENVRVVINEDETTVLPVLKGDILGYERTLGGSIADTNNDGIADNYSTITWEGWSECADESTNELGLIIQVRFADHLFFIIVETLNSTTNVTIPCFLDKKYTIGAVYYKRIIYRNLMQGVKEIESTCRIPKYFIDLHLRKVALDAAIETDNFREAIKIYNSFFGKGIGKNINVEHCNCGR